MVTKEQLIDVGVEKLADIVLSLCKVKPDFEAQLKIILAGCETDPNFSPCAEMIKEEIETLKATQFEYYDADSVAKQTEEIRKHIMENILPDSPNQAIKLLESLLASHAYTLENVRDTGDGFVQEVFQEVCSDLTTLYQRVNTPIEEIVEFVHAQFLEENNRFCIFDDIILDFKHLLGNEGIKQLKQKFEEYFKETNKNASRTREGLRIIANDQNDVDAYIHAYTFTGKIKFYECCDIAKKLIEHQRAKEAISWLDSANSKESMYSKHQVMNLKIEALNACGDYSGAQAERQKHFDVTESVYSSVPLYKEIIKHAEAESIESWKKSALQKVFDMPDSHDALHFLIEVQEFKLAAVLICEKIDSLDGTREHPLREIAEKLSETGPLAATLLYRKIIEHAIVSSKTKNFGMNFSVKRKSSYSSNFKKSPFCNYVKDLNACNRLSSKITDWQGYKNHKLYFEELLVKHKDVTDLWNEYTSVLKQQLAKENQK